MRNLKDNDVVHVDYAEHCLVIRNPEEDDAVHVDYVEHLRIL